LIQGKKVIIRQMEFGDEDFLHQWRNDPVIMAYSELQYGFLRSKEAFRLEVKRNAENLEMFPAEKTFIICKKESLEPIGDIVYRNLDKRNQSAELGVEIANIEERGKGYGSDALYCFIDFLFKFLNLNRIELKTLVDNVAAQRLYEKLGFKRIGLIRDAVFDSRTCQYTDYVYMDLLLRDWLSGQI